MSDKGIDAILAFDELTVETECLQSLLPTLLRVTFTTARCTLQLKKEHARAWEYHQPVG